VWLQLREVSRQDHARQSFEPSFIVSILIEAAVELKARHTHTEIALQFAGTFVYLEARACEGKTIISGSDNPREPRPFRANCCATSTDTLCNHCHWINRNSIVFENLK